MRRPNSDRVFETQAEEASVVETPVVVDVRAWVDINTAPRDGTMVEYQEGKFTRFRITRRRQDGRWTPVGFWQDVFTGEEIAPVQFRLPEGFAAPGMIRA